MQPTNLHEVIGQVEAFAMENDIAVFVAIEALYDQPSVEWLDSGAKSLEKYLAVAHSLGSKLLVVEYEENMLLGAEGCIEEFKGRMDPDDADWFNEALAVVNQHKEEPLGVSVHFLYEGVVYSFARKAAWFKFHDRVCNLVFDEPDDDDDGDDDDEFLEGEIKTTDKKTDESQENQRPSLLSGFSRPSADTTGLVVEQQARKLLQNERFLGAPTAVKRRDIARQLLEEEGFSSLHDVWPIQKKAEELYQQEALPKIEQAIVEKIRTYLATSKNPSLAGPSRLLGIDARRLGKYWEQAKG